MSQFEEKDNPHKGFSRKQIGIIFKIAFLEAMALSIILPSVTSTGEIIGCVPGIDGNCNKRISFDTTVANQSALGMNTVILPLSLTPGDTIVVAGVGEGGTPGTPLVVRVTSVSDSVGDQFTRRVEQNMFTSGTGNNAVNVQLWTAITASSFTKITVISNATAGEQVVAIASSYKNVLDIGNTNSTTTPLIAPTKANVNITSSGDQSLFVGSIGLENTPVSCPNSIIPGINLTQRKVICSSIQNGDVDMEDSYSHTLSTNRIFNYTDSITNGGGVGSPFSLAVIELSPTFVDQSNECTSVNIGLSTCPIPPDIDTFCPTTGDTCHVNAAFRSTGINTAQNIVIGTAYCTGITTTALTTTRASTIIVQGTYGGQSRNDTGAVLLVQFEVSSSIPSTTFGAGQCATGNSIVVNSKITFDTSGITLTAFGLNEYFGSASGSMVETLPTTLYGWIEITPQSVGNVNTGSANAGSTIQFAQWGAIAHSYITIIEV